MKRKKRKKFFEEQHHSEIFDLITIHFNLVLKQGKIK